MMPALLWGCASKPIGTVPAIERPGEAVSVTIRRQYTIVGFPAMMYVVLDDERIYRLWSNASFTFSIDPGEYQLGYDLGFNRCRQRVLFKPGAAYRIELRPICDIEPKRL